MRREKIHNKGNTRHPSSLAYSPLSRSQCSSPSYLNATTNLSNDAKAAAAAAVVERVEEVVVEAKVVVAAALQVHLVHLVVAKEALAHPAPQDPLVLPDQVP